MLIYNKKFEALKSKNAQTEKENDTLRLENIRLRVAEMGEPYMSTGGDHNSSGFNGGNAGIC